MRPVNIQRFLDHAHGVRVLVVGDVMLDVYVSGSASRISPEAPVPVVSVKGRRDVPGGAANVAANVVGLGAGAALAGLTGIDESAVRLRAELDRARIDCLALIEDSNRPTTTKTRITAAGQQIVRFDEETRLPLAAATESLLRERCRFELRKARACVLSDYAKGVAGEDFCRWLMTEAASLDIPVVVDPKSRDLSRYSGATVVTPNLRETAEASGLGIESSDDLSRAVERLLPSIRPSSLLVTRGEEGMSLFEPGYKGRHLPALRNEVADVTGAGDTVVAVLALALGMGFDLFEAACLGNIAAAIAVSHHGTWAVTRDEMAQASAQLDIVALTAAAES